MGYVFVPDFRIVGHVDERFSGEELLSQRGFYAADLDFAFENSSEALKRVLESIPEFYLDDAVSNGMELNVDVRVHELKKGDYPASPGWHCDAPRRETEFSDHGKTTKVLNSLVVNLSSDERGVSNTVFSEKPVETVDDSMTQKTWREMDNMLGTDLSRHYHSSDGDLVMFSPYSPHCIQPAQRDGVRMFVRISQWVKPEGHQPGISKIEQVYRTVVL